MARQFLFLKNSKNHHVASFKKWLHYRETFPLYLIFQLKMSGTLVVAQRNVQNILSRSTESS